MAGTCRMGVSAMKGRAMAIWENWGARTAMWLNDSIPCLESSPRRLHSGSFTDSSSSSPLLRDFGAQEVCSALAEAVRNPSQQTSFGCFNLRNWLRASPPFGSEQFKDSNTANRASRSLNGNHVSSSGAPEEDRYDARTFNQGTHWNEDGERQYVFTLRPSSRTGIHSTTTALTKLPQIRVSATPKYVFSYKNGTYQLLLVGPNSLLLHRSSIKMDFPQPQKTAEATVSVSATPEQELGLHYMRHGKEFLMGVRGTRADVDNIKHRIAHFLRTELHLEVGLSSHVHIQSNSVVFLGTRIAGLLDNKTRRRFSKEVEKRRRSKIRAQRMAEVRTDTWHNELKDLALQSWAFGLKKTKKELQSWEIAKQAMYKKAQELGSKFVFEQVERGQTREAIQRLLNKEEEIFFDAPSTGLPDPILRAHHRLTRLLQRYLDEETSFEKKAKAVERLQPRVKNEEGGGIPLQLVAPMEVITGKLRKKGILQPSKALPTVLTSMIGASDEAIVSYFAALATCLLTYYRCCDNFQKVRRLVDHQVRWSALFTLGSKHGCSARKIIRQFGRGPKIVNRKGDVVVEFPSSPDILRTGKRFLVHVQHSSLDDILRSRRLQLLPSAEKKGPRRVRLRAH